MGVEYITCRFCDDNFPDSGSFVRCECCGTNWCSYECAEADGYEHKEWEEENGDLWEEDSCNYCRGEDFPDSELLAYALEHILGISRYELVQRYKEENK